MAAKRTYLDDTGKYANWSRMVRVYAPREPGEKQRVSDPLMLLGISGATGTVDEWKRIGIAWQEILGSFGLTVFHAADFDARAKSFRGLSNGQRDDLITKLVSAIAGIQPLVALLRPELYAYSYDDPGHSGDLDEEREHDPCFWFCLSRAALQAGGGETEIVFARTPKYVGRPMFLHRCFVEHHGSGSHLERDLSVVAAKDILQLQVADLIVWGFNRLIGRNPDPKEEPEAFDRYAWWVERFSNVVLPSDDCRLLSREEAEQTYVEIADLCFCRRRKESVR